MTYYYQALFTISLLLSLAYTVKWRRRYNVYFTLEFTVLPIACFGYLQEQIATTLDHIILAKQLSYLGGTFGTLFMTLCICYLCKFNLSKNIRRILFAIIFMIYLTILIIPQTNFFYRDMSVNVVNGVTVFSKKYGPAHVVFNVILFALFTLNFIAVLRGMGKRYDVSLTTTVLLFIAVLTNFVAFFFGRMFLKNLELIPIGYVASQILMLFLPERMVLYNVDDTLVDVSVERGDIAIISLDKKKHFLGCNSVAKEFFPQLNRLKIDENLLSGDDFCQRISTWAGMVKKENGKVGRLYGTGGKYYKVIGDVIRNGSGLRGYNFMITDDTQQQNYLRLIRNYNATLEKDVEKKTKEIVEINDIFGKNVSPQIRDYLLKGNISLGGEKREATVMFCDIRGFTTLSENMAGEKVVQLLNTYFTGLEKCITANNGVINKYIGDAVMALFGVPIPSGTHQKDAYQAALAMRKELVELNKEFKKKGLPELRFGIGLHSGTLLAGNIGAASRMEYTVIGDTVNTASRIEGLCKTYKSDLLISSSTADALTKSGIQLKFVADAAIRGRSEKVELYSD